MDAIVILPPAFERAINAPQNSTLIVQLDPATMYGTITSLGNLIKKEWKGTIAFDWTEPPTSMKLNLIKLKTRWVFRGKSCTVRFNTN